MRNATGCGNSREEGEKGKKNTSKAEDRKNGVSEVRSGMWKCKKELTCGKNRGKSSGGESKGQIQKTSREERRTEMCSI